MEAKYHTGIGTTAGSMMIKWVELDKHIAHILSDPSDHVNVFINFESILDNLSHRRNVLQMIVNFKQQFVLEMESAILNVAANYRMYFKKHQKNCKIFFYYTDLTSDKQIMRTYKKYYRKFYFNKYNNNPQYRDILQIVKRNIIKEVELICQYIDSVYFVRAKGFDSSIIPKMLEGDNNVIITTDRFDTLYHFDGNITPIYLCRDKGIRTMISDLDSMILYLLKDDDVSRTTQNMFHNKLYYQLLLLSIGDVYRNIDVIRELKTDQMVLLLQESMKSGSILMEYTSLTPIMDIFPKKHVEMISENYRCMSLDTHEEMLTNGDREYVQTQLVDKIDVASLSSLNNRRFLEFPLNLQGLM